MTDLNRNVTKNDNLVNCAGQLKIFLKVWQSLGAPSHVIQLISGYKIPFCLKPPLIHPVLIPKHFHTKPSLVMDQQLKNLIRQGVLEPVSSSPSFVSGLFLVPKGSDAVRTIFNLQRLNNFILTSNFHLTNMYKVPDFLQPRDWLVKFDLKDAYFHVPVHPVHRCFLRVIYKGQLLQMTCLPFGLATSPKAFATITNWVAQLLRDQGVRVIVYLDDFLLVSQSRELLLYQTSQAIQLVQSLGFSINFKKSSLVPKHRLEFLGVEWDTWENCRSLPREKILKIDLSVKKFLITKSASLKQTQQLLGLLNFASFVVPRGRLRTRELMFHSIRLLKCPVNKKFPLPKIVLGELKWWLTHTMLANPIQQPPPEFFLATDASAQGWGGQLNDLLYSGSWSQHERMLHSNVLELLAILKILKIVMSQLKNKCLSISSDNRSVVAYLRNEGGTKSSTLMKLTFKILTLLDQNHVQMSIHFIPGRYNSVADRLSRSRGISEWHLTEQATTLIFSLLGVPEVDLFASHRAHVVPLYVSMDLTDSNALYVNAFSQVWNYERAWLFPPPSLIPRVLSHLNSASGSYLLAVPKWEKVFWRSDLRARALMDPVQVDNLEEVLIDVFTGRPPPEVKRMTLEVWLIRGGPPC